MTPYHGSYWGWHLAFLNSPGHYARHWLIIEDGWYPWGVQILDRVKIALHAAIFFFYYRICDRGLEPQMLLWGKSLRPCQGLMDYWSSTWHVNEENLGHAAGFSFPSCPFCHHQEWGPCSLATSVIMYAHFAPYLQTVYIVCLPLHVGAYSQLTTDL